MTQDVIFKLERKLSLPRPPTRKSALRREEEEEKRRDMMAERMER